MSDVITSKKWAYNSQEIKQLQRVLKRTPLLIQERPLQYARKAYSQTLKGMFLNQEKHVESLRGVKILTNNKRVKRRKGWGELILWTRFVHKILWYNIRERNIRLSWKYKSLTERHRRTEHTAFHRDIKSTDFTEPYSQQRPHPQPLSEWRGEWLPRLPLPRGLHRDGIVGLS